MKSSKIQIKLYFCYNDTNMKLSFKRQDFKFKMLSLLYKYKYTYKYKYKQAGFAVPHSSLTIGLVGVGLGWG